MREYKIIKNPKTGIYCLTEGQTSRAFSGDPNGGNVQGLLLMILGVHNAGGVKGPFRLEVKP